MNDCAKWCIYLLTSSLLAAPLFAAPKAPPADKPITKHLRSTKGIPFPEKIQSDKKTRQLNYNPALSQTARAKFMADPTRSKVLPACTEDKREKQPVVKKVKKEDLKRTFIDLIFIRKDQLPRDPDLAFGTKARLLTYEGNGSGFDSAINGLKIPCLPYRMRVTPAHIFTEQGTPALKNYDKNPQGEGELTEVMKLKLKNASAL